MNIRHTLLIPFLFATAHFETTFATAKPTACEVAKTQFETAFDRLQKEYVGIENETVAPINQPTWHDGSGVHKNQIVYLLHGFIGTPNEMKATALLAEQNGFTVVNDIIPGHGATADISNLYPEQSWRDHVFANLDALRKCSNKIHVVGFSTGGLLLHDYLLQNRAFTAASIVYYSPFFKAHLKYAKFLANAAAKFTATVSVKLMYALTRFQDIRVATLKRDTYMHDLPLDTLKAIRGYGQRIYEVPAARLNGPMLLFATENDQTADHDSNVEKMRADFKDFHLVNFASQQNVPHHVMVKEVSPVATLVQQKTIDFILKAAK